MTQADLDVLHAFVGDRLSPEAFPRLESLLRTSPLARRTLRGFTLVEEGLGDIAEERFFDALKPESRRPQPVTPASQPTRRRWPRPLALPSLGSIGSRRLALTALLVAGIVSQASVDVRMAQLHASRARVAAARSLPVSPCPTKGRAGR